MANDLVDLIENIFRIIILIIMVFVAYQVLRAVVGGTWATEDIIIAGVGIMMTGIFVVVGFLINQAKSIGRLEAGLINCFDRVVRIENNKKQLLFI